MAEPTHTPSTTDSAVRVIGWCAWHRDIADDVRVVQAIEAGSGPGSVRMACSTCIAEHGLVPLAEQAPVR